MSSASCSAAEEMGNRFALAGQNMFVRRNRPVKLCAMVRSIHILLLSACSMVSARVEFSDTRTVEHGLRGNTEVLVNSQGLAQHDLSIRGSSYTGAGISLNGLNLKAPWSAHWNSELPLPSYLLSATEVRYGAANVSGHLVGTAGYETVPQMRAPNAGALRRQAAARIGTEEHYGATTLGGTGRVGGFLDGEKARRIDYSANDLERAMGGAHAQHVHNDWQFDLVGAHQRKEFGTQGYFGNPAYAEQTVEDSLVFLGASHGDPDDTFIRAGTAFRQMDIDAVDSRFGAAMLEGRTMEIQHIALNLRGDLENEYADGADRTRGSVLILPEARFECFTVKAGLNSVFQTSESAEFLPTAGIDWFATDNSRIYAAYSENIQQPDFQTLADNPQLQQQKSKTSELGFRQFLSASLDWRIAGFYRRLEHASDWIGGTATDLGDLNVSGLDSAVSWYPSANLELQAYYQWIYKDNEISGGLYETDFPEHLMNLSAYWKFLNEFALEFVQAARYQTGNPARTSSDFGAHASLGLHYFPRFAQNVRLSFRVDNLWGSDFQVIPGLKPRPATATAGVTVAW
jgi:hypothetical protein